MDPTILAIIAAVVAPLGAYLVAARQFSGKIETSDAKDLWAESRSIRDWSQQRIAALEARVDALENSNDELVAENRTLTRQNRDQNETISGLRDKVQALTEDLNRARLRIAELENNARS